jgi:hypothetical protein
VAIAPPSRALLALGLALLAPAAGSAELGTLFHTPEERARLDRLRRGEPEVAHAARSGPPVITGYVKRSDGRATIWIDGRPLVVTAPEVASHLDAKSVRAHSGRSDESFRIERKAPR